MICRKNLYLTAAASILITALSAVPALADVRAGVDAWSRGDYAAAVNEWEGPAGVGDPDAMFNMGQAYRLGRGVGQDSARAEALYARAAQAGHVQAADTYGLMLFQDGRREEALPLVADAARRGDPRSQYLLGIAHFNGDIVDRDWVLAYALLTMANSQGLPQAAPAIAEMDGFISLEQRQEAAGLAEQLRAEAASARAVELAAADLGTAGPVTAMPVAAAPVPPQASARVPRPIATTAVSPSIVAARSAIAEASRATGTESPSNAGARYATGNTPVPVAVAPRRAGVAAATVAPPPAPVRAAVAPAPTPAPASRSNGPWRVQLGAFSVAGNAEALWSRLSSRSELAGRERMLVPTGRVTRLMAGGYATRAEATTACNSLKNSGQDCLVTRN